MHLTEWKLRGVSVEDLEKALRQDIESSTIATWGYGARADWFGARSTSPTRYQPKADRQLLVAPTVQAYRDFGEAELRGELSTMDYVILEKSHPLIATHLSPVREFARYGIYRVR